MTTQNLGTDARHLWTIIEPIHAVTYFAPEARTAFEEVGLRGFWRGYFAGRSAPLGRATDALVAAAFFGFAPEFVGRAIPHVWEQCSPGSAIAARQAGAAASLCGHIGPFERPTSADAGGNSANLIDPQSDGATRTFESGEATMADVKQATLLLQSAVEYAAEDPRLLGMSNARLDTPEDDLESLWHTCTVLREHRGDGHVCALVLAGLSPCQSTVLRCAVAGTELATVSNARGWPAKAWLDAHEELQDRGLVEAVSQQGAAQATSRGRELLSDVEDSTDQASAYLFSRARTDMTMVSDLLAPLARAIQVRDTVPYPNAIGVPGVDEDVTPSTPK